MCVYVCFCFVVTQSVINTLQSTSLYLMGIRNGSYCYMQSLTMLDTMRPTPGVSSPQWARGPTPINHLALTEALASHPVPQFRDYILQGIYQGFRIGFNRQTTVPRSSTRNHPSALACPDKTMAQLAEEIWSQRLLGPVNSTSTNPPHVSPIGLIPKPHSDRFRLIVDLSHPQNHSINDGINSLHCSLKYASVHDAVSFISALGPNTVLIKVDLKNAYRILPIHPEDMHLLGISWGGNTYIDRALPFGLRSAPLIFTAFADAIAWILYSRGIHFLIHYLDDFLLFVPPGSTEGQQVLSIVLDTLATLGVPIANDKIEGPSTVVTFLGILIDTTAYQLRIPPEKLHRLKTLVTSWQSRRSSSRKSLESLLGRLSHAASIIKPGRTFLRQLFILLSRVRVPYHHVHLDATARADLAWWNCFLQTWNGTSLFPPDTTNTVHVYADASGGFGVAAIIPYTSWFQCKWPPSWEEISIACKELLPIVVAAALWGSTWTGRHVTFHSDNMAVTHVLESRTAQQPLMMHLLRCLAFYTAYYKFDYSSLHIPGHLNTAADALSRNNLCLFLSLDPQAQQITVPFEVLNLLILNPPNWGSRQWTELFTSTLLSH